MSLDLVNGENLRLILLKFDSYNDCRRVSIRDETQNFIGHRFIQHGLNVAIQI